MIFDKSDIEFFKEEKALTLFCSWVFLIIAIMVEIFLTIFLPESRQLTLLIINCTNAAQLIIAIILIVKIN